MDRISKENEHSKNHFYVQIKVSLFIQASFEFLPQISV